MGNSNPPLDVNFLPFLFRMQTHILHEILNKSTFVPFLLLSVADLGFARKNSSTQDGVHQLINLQMFCSYMLHENQRIWGALGSVRHWLQCVGSHLPFLSGALPARVETNWISRHARRNKSVE